MKIFITQATLLTLAIVIASLGGFRPEPQASAKVIAIRNVTVIPGNGAPPINDATVLIRDELIAAIGPSAETVIPTGARVIKGRGKFLVPGFIEMHAHLSKTREWCDYCSRHGWRSRGAITLAPGNTDRQASWTTHADNWSIPRVSSNCVWPSMSRHTTTLMRR